MGDVVFLDADENKIETPFADLDSLPSEIVSSFICQYLISYDYYQIIKRISHI